MVSRRRPTLLALCLLASPAALAQGAAPAAPATAPAPTPLSPEARRWWGHVEWLASDARAGRDTGSPGYDAAARYVAAEFARLGLKPAAGKGGYQQPVAFESRRVVEARSRLAWVRDGKEQPLTLGEHATLSARLSEAGALEAPVVFAGYGLSLPEAGHDDLAGLDVKGKLVLVLTGAGPSGISGALRAHGSSTGERWKALQAAGAIGLVTVANPKRMDIPWERATLARHMPGLVLADAALQDGRGMKLNATLNPAHMDAALAGSGHTWADLLALAEQGKPLPRFDLPGTLRAEVALETKPVRSSNVVGVLPGSDPALKGEYVVLSGHLDHVGTGQPINGDRIYNGAMDNASGIAALFEVARALSAEKVKPRRSVLFVALTAEEKGLLGSRYFAARPTVPAGSIVANVNVDMFMPLHPLERLVGYGLEESSLEEPLRAAGEAAGVAITTDPEPDRMLFVRSDQYNFVRVGVPALAFKFGYAPGSPQEALHKEWIRTRYHAPSDDLQQPVDREAAVRFTRLMADFTRRVADAEARPSWREKSFFRRFAPALTQPPAPTPAQPPAKGAGSGR
jgi:hypothetical protein